MDKLGDRFDVVTVKNGYGRNYLIPQGLARIANKTNMTELEDLKNKEEEAELQRLSEYQAIAEKLQAAPIRIGAKAGTSGKIFGSVTNVQLAAAIKDEMGLDIERKKIVLQDEIKELGSYVADVILHKQVIAKLAFEVVGE